MLCRDSNLPVKCWPPCFVFWILKSSSLSYVCPIDVGSCHLDYLARLLSFNFKWDSLRLTERSSPKIADYRFSQAFAIGRTTSTLQVWTFVVFVLTVLKYEQNTWFQIIMAWYDISSRFDQNCGLWLIESWKSSPTFGWNDQLTIIKGGDLLKQCHSFVDWWESTCSYIAQIVGPRPPLIQMSTEIRGANLEQRGV